VLTENRFNYFFGQAVLSVVVVASFAVVTTNLSETADIAFLLADIITSNHPEVASMQLSMGSKTGMSFHTFRTNNEKHRASIR
jgi:hypothetical protein